MVSKSSVKGKLKLLKKMLSVLLMHFPSKSYSNKCFKADKFVGKTLSSNAVLKQRLILALCLPMKKSFYGIIYGDESA